MRAKLDAIEDRLDVTTLERAPADELELNAIGRVRLRLGGELAADPYALSRATGAFILIDEGTNDTVGAGHVRRYPHEATLRATGRAKTTAVAGRRGGPI